MLRFGNYPLWAVVVLRAVVISATAQITIAAATAVRADSLSPAIAHPRSTATIGLTYAYVPRCAGETLSSSQMYDVKPSSDPNVIRYARPMAEARETW